jgi:membrane peptidoglycan carboxypeptidase
MLASLLKGADQYDPALSTANHKRAVERWSWILDRQVEVGLMSASERAKYRVFPEPKRQSMSTSMAGQTGYLVAVADNYIRKSVGLTAKDLARGGYQIHTTFEKDKVERLQQAVKEVTGSAIDPKKRAADRYVEVGAASVRPKDGAIVALYGGADATKHFTNNADTSGVPVGSVFKPFVLAAYFQGVLGDKSGGIPAMALGAPDLPVLESALVTSSHAPFVQLGKDVGWARIRDTAVKSGMTPSSMAPLEQTFSIGTSTPSAIRMADAYATFANDGMQTDPYSVTRILKDGKPLGGLDRPRSRRALEPNTVAVVNEVLHGVARTNGTKIVDAASASVATGDNDRTKSAWFVGYSPDLSTAVTLFRNKPGKSLLPLQGVGGDDSARGNVFPPRIWARFMGGAKDFSLNHRLPTLAVPAPGPKESPGPTEPAGPTKP